MTEKKDSQFENIKNVNTLYSSGLADLMKAVSGTRASAESVVRAIGDKQKELISKRLEREAEEREADERREREEQSRIKAEEAAKATVKAEVAPVKQEAKPAVESAPAVKETAPDVKVAPQPTTIKITDSAPVKQEASAPEKSEPKASTADNSVKEQPISTAKPVSNSDSQTASVERPSVSQTRPSTERQDRPAPRTEYRPRSDGSNGYSPRPDSSNGYTPRLRPDGTPYPPRPRPDGSTGYAPRLRPDGTPYPPRPRPDGSTGYTPRLRPDGTPYPPRPRPDGSTGYAPRLRPDGTPYPPRTGTGYAPRLRPDGTPYPPRTGGGAPYGNRSFVPAPNVVSQPYGSRDASKIKKKPTDNKSYEEKKSAARRALVKKPVVSIEDFDENASGYRKVRVKKQRVEEKQTVKVEKAIINTETIPVKMLSDKLGITAVEITKRLFKEGIIKTINDNLDFDTAGFIAAGLGIELELKLDKTAEDFLSEEYDEAADTEANLVHRAPVVTVMGHVDHGKTSLLDKIRSANVTAGEAGGITQHIGAYTVTLKGKTITFLDTPGHAAFTSMRARGAQVTDIAVLVVAADDGVMPQTIEAINHAKAANVPIIVAINKIDRPEANIDRIKQQLTEHGILPEDWGGDCITVPLSAKTGENVDKLLESIQLVAEVRDLKANPKRKARGTIIEAKLDKGKGPLATVLIQNGTLKTGDNIVAGTVVGKVRGMIDDKGRLIKEAGPSTPVSVLGLSEVPNAGDLFYAVEQEKLTKLVAEERKNKEKEDMSKRVEKVTLEEVYSKIAEGNMKTLNLIIKADVQGSVEAVVQSLSKLSNEEVKVVVIHSAVGAITETDVMLADSSNAIIIGFNVRPDVKAKNMAEKAKVDIRLYRIIYEAIEAVQGALSGMLAPVFEDIMLGKAQVRETFKITGVGMVAGCYVTEGKITRSGKLRIYRNDVMICDGNVLQLKRFKDDVKEVASGYECGLSIENFNYIKNDDIIECYMTQQKKRT